MIPEMIPVNSSHVAEVGYDINTQTLYVKYLDQKLYIYKEVPEDEFERLLVADSIGSYLHWNIKIVYPYEQIG